MNPADSIFPVLFPVIAVVVIVAFVIAIVIYTNKKAAERRRALEQAAAQLGWAFAADADFSFIPGLEQYHLFSQGHSKKLFNLIYGTVEGGRAAIFDYRYTVGYGKNSHTYTQSVVYFQSAALSLPFFSLRPEGFGHKIISALGYQDIDFGHRPEFSSRYLLRGHDEQMIRRTFHDAALSYYETNPKLCTDGGAGEIFFYRQNVQVEPQNVSALLDWGLRMLNLFQRPW